MKARTGTGMNWYAVIKSQDKPENDRIIDCVQASDIEAAFQWAMGKWANMIARSHDAAPDGTGSYCLYVTNVNDIKPAMQLRPASIIDEMKKAASYAEQFGIVAVTGA